MRIGAKIVLDTGLDAACAGLASLAGCGWLMSLPSWQDPYHGHPAGRALPGAAGRGSGPGLIAVTFGTPRRGQAGMLPVQWESVEPGEVFSVLLVYGELALTWEQGHSTLSLAGSCRLLPAADVDSSRRQYLVVRDAALSFITGVAVAIARIACPSLRRAPGPASAWLAGQR